jgi:DUF1680 family protein
MEKHSPYATVMTLPLHSTQLEGGFWSTQVQRAHTVIIANIYRLFASDEISHCLANFRIAAGLQEGTHQGPPFGDGDFYKWLEAASYTWAVTGDEELKGMIDSAIELIGQVQHEDGYIFTQYSIRLKEGREASRLGDSLNFEAYNLGHLITASIVHARSTHETTLLELGIKAALCLNTLFEEAERTKSGKTAICPSHYMALVELWRHTGDPTHLKTAELAIRLRDSVVGGTDDNQDRLTLAEHDEILGHAVRATYLYSGVADLYAELGKPEHLLMLQRVWQSEEYTKMYINSGVGALYDGVSPAGFAGDHPALSRTHQSFGRPYQLPNLTAYNETCATIGNIFFNWRLFLINGNAAHIDRIEQSFYNLILASTSRDGLRYFYSNPLAREEEPLPFYLKWERTRSEYLSSFCCPPNMVRALVEVSEYTWALRDDEILVGMYAQGTTTIHIGEHRVVLEQQTEYPWDGTVRIIVTECDGSPFTLSVRVPSWLKSGTLSYGPEELTLTEADANTYIPITRSWKVGDELVLSMDMEARLVLAHPMVENSSHQVAVMRGPLLYCSEQVDHPKTDWASLGVRSNPIFRTVWRTIAEESLLCLETNDGADLSPLDWDNHTLYQDAESLEARPQTLHLIPYFAWDNRGLGGMKIFHPLYLSPV